MTATTQQAESIKKEILSVCNKFGLWYTIEHENKPDLRMIRIKEISIKIKDN